MSDQEDAAADGEAAVEAAGENEGEGTSSNGGHDEADGEGAAEAGAGAEAAGEEPGTVPQVELGLHELSVAVTGQQDDDLGDVSDTARDLMAFLVDRAEELSDEPDQYGLS